MKENVRSSFKKIQNKIKHNTTKEKPQSWASNANFETYYVFWDRLILKHDPNTHAFLETTTDIDVETYTVYARKAISLF